MNVDTAWEKFLKQRQEKIAKTVDSIYLDLVEEGFGESPSTRCSALYRALEIIPECKDEEIFKAGYNAAMAAKGN